MTILSKTDLKAVSIFTGAGGLDIGFERAGFSIVSAVELHPKYCETILVNQSRHLPIPNSSHSYYENTMVFNADIADISGDQLANGNEEIDCLIGGPPCQAFSSAGKQLSIFDHRGTLIYEYLRILNELQPKTFLFENVRGLVTARGNNGTPGEVLQELLERFNKAGYNCRVSLLNSADYGAYQRRVRCFIMGSRIAAAPLFPTPEYAEQECISLIPEACRQEWRSLSDFLALYADNEESQWVRPTPDLSAQLKDVPDGSGLKSKGRVEATRPSGHWGYRQGTFIADKSKPARTVTGSSSQDWIRLADGSLRRLTEKEVALLQGFPTEWLFCGTKADRFQQIGNAVPTVFGEVLGKTIAQYIKGEYKSLPDKNDTVLPKDIQEAIRYTIYDNSRNGSFRANALQLCATLND